MAKPILTISQVAARFGISVRTIRVYEEEGFITVERCGRQGLLRPSDVEAIAMIQRLRSDLGVNLAGIGVILEMRRQIEELRQRVMELDSDG